MILTLLTTLLIIDAIVLFFLILLLQHGNEGGIGGSLGGGNSTGMFGASGGVKLIVRATWICGALFFILALGSSWVRTNERYAMKNTIEKSLTETTEAERLTTTTPIQKELVESTNPKSNEAQIP